MNQTTRAEIEATFAASQAGRIHFGEVIGRLLQAQVECYQVDYRAGRATFYGPDGSTHDQGFDRPVRPIAEDFDGDGVRAAIRGAQQGQVMYPEFKRLTQQAGCIGYTVWMTGRHVSYFGRRGETHVERFPD